MNRGNTVFFLKEDSILRLLPSSRPLPIGERGRVRGKSGAKGRSRRENLHLEDFRGFILETIS
jgi:hypothetical protein